MSPLRRRRKLGFVSGESEEESWASHWCRALDSKQGFQIQPLLWEDVNEARGLPFDDPFDCLIAGTAFRIGVPLITKDTVISESGLLETVW